MKNPFTAVLIALTITALLLLGFLEWDYFFNRGDNPHPDQPGLDNGLRFLVLLISAVTSAALFIISAIHFLAKKEKNSRLIPAIISLAILLYCVLNI